MLNGKHYDALTGKLIKDKEQPSSSNLQKTPEDIKKTSSGSIDGVVNPVTTPHKKPSRAVHQTARAIQHSKTLMRSVVNKPTKSVKTDKNTVKQTSPKKHIDRLSAKANPTRINRAQKIPKSTLISKFGVMNTNKPKLSPLPVRPEPTRDTAMSTSTKQQEITRTPSKQPTNRFQNAIDNATSHTQKSPKRVSRRTKVAHKLRISPRMLNFSLITLTFLVLGGYFAYNNVSNLAMKVASSRSGINGSLPKYQPAGFAMRGPIQYQPGQITIGFKSNSDERNYTVIERTSEWDSETLLDNHVAVNKRSYQTFQDKGKTIYIYDGDSASWVDNGVWYEIDGNTALDTDQVLRIANSL